MEKSVVEKSVVEKRAERFITQDETLSLSLYLTLSVNVSLTLTHSLSPRTNDFTFVFTGALLGQHPARQVKSIARHCKR